MQFWWICLWNSPLYPMKFCLINYQHMEFPSFQYPSFINSYLINRKQQIQINSIFSSLADTHKGVPQGSIIGPLDLFLNAFIHDIFYLIKHGTLYNYVDNNTLSFCSPDYAVLISTLETESRAAFWIQIWCFLLLFVPNLIIVVINDMSCKKTSIL